MRSMKLAFVFTALLLFCGISFAQSNWRWQQRDDRPGTWDNRRNTQDNRRNSQYDKGLRDGRNDRAHNRRPHPRHDDAEYRRGYRAGYGGNWRDNDRDADDRRGRGPYGDPNATGRWGGGRTQQGRNTQQVAYNNGYQEGLRYGQADRGSHSYRPTYSDNYKHGETGYIASMGDKNVYRQNFQQGFLAGYDRGYGPH